MGLLINDARFACMARQRHMVNTKTLPVLSNMAHSTATQEDDDYTFMTTDARFLCASLAIFSFNCSASKSASALLRNFTM
jgi:hypothetical protein